MQVLLSESWACGRWRKAKTSSSMDMSLDIGGPGLAASAMISGAEKPTFPHLRSAQQILVAKKTFPAGSSDNPVGGPNLVSPGGYSTCLAATAGTVDPFTTSVLRFLVDPYRPYVYSDFR